LIYPAIGSHAAREYDMTSGAENSRTPLLRRWFRFSLRTLLIAAVLFSVALGWVGNVLIRVRHQRQIVAYIEARGGRVMYDYQLAQTTGLFVNEKAVPPGPGFVRFLLGDDVFAHVEDVAFVDSKRAVTDQDLQHLSELPRLKDLWIANGGGITDTGIEHIGRLPDLRTLILADADVSPRGLDPLRTKLNLRTLDLHGRWVNDESLASIGDIPELTDLSLTGASITSVGISKLDRLKNLRSLYIREVRGFDDVGMRKLTELGLLESLTLRDTSISDEALALVAELQALKELMIFDAPISDRGVVHLAALKNLTNLSLKGDAVGDDSLEVLSELDSLESLSMHGTGITDEGLRYVATMKNLKFLYITETKMSDDGIMQLKSLAALKRVQFGPFVTPEGAKELKRALPDCDIGLFNRPNSITGDTITLD
jgi:internalin A